MFQIRCHINNYLSLIRWGRKGARLGTDQVGPSEYEWPLGGFARIDNNEITILVNDENDSDIDPQVAQQTLQTGKKWQT